MAKQSPDLFHSILIYQPGFVNVVDQQAGLFVVPFESFTWPLYGFVLHTQPSRGLLTVLVYDLLIGLTHTHTQTQCWHMKTGQWSCWVVAVLSIVILKNWPLDNCSWAFRLDVSTAPGDLRVQSSWRSISSIQAAESSHFLFCYPLHADCLLLLSAAWYFEHAAALTSRSDCSVV